MTKCVYFFLRESENLMTMTIKCLLTDIECSVDTNKSQNEHIFKYKNAWENKDKEINKVLIWTSVTRRANSFSNNLYRFTSFYQCYYIIYI